MKTIYLPGLLLSGVLICSAQTAALSDPTLDSTGLPAYLKLLAQPAAEPWRPITETDRFANYASLTLSPYAGLSSLFGAAITQGLDRPHEWGQGGGAFRTRVASSYGSTFIAYTITYGMSVVSRDDNRYFRSNKGGLKARLAHVLVSPYQAHGNAGQLRFSTSSFLGGVGGATIPLLWSPGSWQGWKNVALNYAVWYGGLAGVNFVREFYPSLVRHYKSKHQAEVQ
jgi:hypothetical protein